MSAFASQSSVPSPGVSLPASTPYKDTPLYLLPSGKMEFGLWNGDTDVLNSSEYDLYQINSSEIGRLDLLSYYAYDTPAYWWLIAWANNFIDPIRDMQPGDFIKIPHRSVIDNYIKRNSRL